MSSVAINIGRDYFAQINHVACILCEMSCKKQTKISWVQSYKLNYLMLKVGNNS